MKHLILPQTPWLLPEEHGPVVDELDRLGMLKYSNARDLPLKNGGETDIYINLRNMRSRYEATLFLARLYKLALDRLDIHRFVEVPEAVSGLAGALTAEARLPYITVRELEKKGRATDARIVGDYSPRDRVVILDDVITDGGSKIVPYQTCRRLGLDVLGLLVLVDRQQGWQQHLSANDINTRVWAGMTLHDVRRHLIQNGRMERCTAEAEERNPIIVALDGKSWEEILPLVDRLRPTGTILKVNDLAFALGSDWILPNLSVYGRVMLDFKVHEIPNTVENICRRLEACPPWALTAHLSGGGEMLKAALKVVNPLKTLLLGVTVLTSIDPKTCEEVYHRRPATQVKALAKMGWDAGVRGFVCSPEEASMLRHLYPEAPLVCPGVRSPGADVGDQKRVSTPAEALADGANYIVGGRQFLGAPDPVAEINRVLTEELKIVA